MRVAKEKLQNCQAALKEHDDEQQAQRAGMQNMRNELLKDPTWEMFHIDAKKHQRIPTWKKEPRNIPKEKFMVHTVGESRTRKKKERKKIKFQKKRRMKLFFFISSSFFDFLLISFAGFHDMKTNVCTNFLLEDSAGTEDTAMITSLIRIFMEKVLKKEKPGTKKLTLIFDNCS